MTNLFVYGTLLNDEVMQALVGKTFQTKPAALGGYLVSCLADRAAPGMVASDGAIARGQLVLDVDDISLQMITEWEGSDYTATSVTVKLEDGNSVKCLTFVWNGSVLEEPWDNLRFREEALAWYLETDIPAFLASR